jgi:hypothetical protein
MKTETLGSTNAQRTKGRKPVVGITCVVLLILAIGLVFAAGPSLGGEIDVHLRYILPFVGAALVLVAIIRRERAIWWVLGFVFTAVYVGLHCIAIP